jgi:hypothetical protein
MPSFDLLMSKAEMFKNLKNFNPNTHAAFTIFMAKYEDCLVQAMSFNDRPPETPMHQLVDTLMNFLGDVSPKDADALAKCREALHALVTKAYN